MCNIILEMRDVSLLGLILLGFSPSCFHLDPKMNAGSFGDLDVFGLMVWLIHTFKVSYTLKAIC